MSGLNEVLAVYLMAAKQVQGLHHRVTPLYNLLMQGVPVCPHAGGVGLCNMVPHLQAWDYIALSGTTENRIVEWVDHLHYHFEHPPSVKNAR